MGKCVLFCVMGLLLAGPLRAADPEMPVDVTADRLEYVGEQIVADGHVLIEYNGDKMAAEYITVNPTTGDSYARGNVRLTRDENTWEGEEVRYNFKTGVGEFGDFKASSGAFRITAKESRRLSESEIELKGVTLTTCDDDDLPYYSVEIKECVLIDEHIIKAKHASVWLGRLPVFYFPYIKRDLDGGLVNTQIGKSGDLGFFARNRITYDIDDATRAESHADFYSKRGVGIGQDLLTRYDRGRTDLGFYYIKDVRADEENGIGATHPDYNEYDPDRYRVRVESTANSVEDDRDYLKARINAWSDPDVVENYFSDEYNRQSQPESFVGIARSGDQSTLGLSAVYQFSDAYDSVDRLPEFSFDQYRKSLGAGVFYRSENEASYLQKRDNNYATVDDEYEAMRLDTFHEVERPVEFFDFLNVTPRASYRGTLYSDSPTDDAKFRNVFEFGAEASFKAYKVLTDKPGWYGEGLRHMVQPYVNYTYRPDPNVQPTNQYTSATSDLYRFDDVDDLDQANDISFGVRNVFQTRKNKRIRKFMDLDLYTTLDLEPEEGERAFDTVSADLEFWFTERLNAELDFEYNSYENDFDPFNVRVEMMCEDGSSFRGEYRWREDENDTLMLQASLWPKYTYSVDTYVRFDFEEEEFDDTNIILKRKLDCVGVGLGYRHDQGDSQIWMYMWILAFGEDRSGL